MMESLRSESESPASPMLEHDQPRAIMDHQMKDARHRPPHRFYVHSPIINNEQKDNFSRFLSLRHAARKLMKKLYIQNPRPIVYSWYKGLIMKVKGLPDSRSLELVKTTETRELYI